MNTSNVQFLFLKIQGTSKLSSWPVAFSSGTPSAFGLSSPMISKNGSVEGYYDGNYASWDTIPIELGAFAVNIDYLRKVSLVNHE
jgi:hypothetical protein